MSWLLFRNWNDCQTDPNCFGTPACHALGSPVFPTITLKRRPPQDDVSSYMILSKTSVISCDCCGCCLEIEYPNSLTKCQNLELLDNLRPLICWLCQGQCLYMCTHPENACRWRYSTNLCEIWWLELMAKGTLGCADISLMEQYISQRLNLTTLMHTQYGPLDWLCC